MKKSQTLSPVAEPPKQKTPTVDVVQEGVERLEQMGERIGTLRQEIESLAAELNSDLAQHADAAAVAIIEGRSAPAEPPQVAQRREKLEGLRRTLSVVEKKFEVEADEVRRSAHFELARRFKAFSEAKSEYSEFLMARLLSVLRLLGEIEGDADVLGALGRNHIAARLDADFRASREAEGRGLVSGMSADCHVAAESLVKLSGAPTAEICERIKALAELMRPWNEVQARAEAKLERLK